MIKNNKKGFTLIELLAVIIILGILMIIAIPSVTSYISDSRKEAYIKTAKQVVSGARNLVNEGKLEMYDTNTSYYVPNSCIKIENGVARSPYGDFVEAYVGVTYNGSGYKYYWISVDEVGEGIDEVIESDNLSIDNIKSDLSTLEIDPIPIENTSLILILDENDCNTFYEYEPGPETIDTLYNQMENIFENNGNVALYDRIHQDTLDNSGTKNIYHYKGNSSVNNSNNLIFANLCWKILRTTDTGGIRILYNGFPENNQCLDTRPTNVGYSGYTYVRLNDGEYYYSDDYSYDNSTKKFTLIGNPIKKLWNKTDSSLIGKYVCKTGTTTCSTLYYVDTLYTSTSSYYDVLAATLNGNQSYSQFGKIPYSYYKEPARYVGYMYGDNDDLINHIIENKYDSTIKKMVDLWYEKYLLKYTNYFEDTVFCNDRRLSSNNDLNSTTIYFVNAYIPQYNNTSNFELSCGDEYDRFSISNPKAKLKYPVALTTSQELGLLNSNSARTSSGDFWTMSPYSYNGSGDSYYGGAYVRYAGSDGRVEPSAFDYNRVKTVNGVRPQVSLKPNVKFYKGTGTKDDPYVIYSGK